ncbi:hypothetical protein VTN77DRAFT_5667 [Rasamsonia byssochlamydoides]|uniref:uncharacterized protein n=1 Tax=Rasamsonia byssochlamydoides TaxID=89139 RepID=UPI003742A6A1
MNSTQEQKYALLRDTDRDSLAESVHQSRENLPDGVAYTQSRCKGKGWLWWGFLLVLLGANVTLGALYLGTWTESHDHPGEISKYAGLAYDKPTVFDWESEYGPSSENRTRQDELWESLAISPGMVALTDDFARSKGLHLSQRFPWDQSRGIYLLNGYHKLHCLKKIRRWIVATERGSHRIDKFHHIEHCLDILRQDILCEADDLPLYTTPGPSKDSGVNEVHHCRDWNKLEAWAKANTACFGYVNETGDESGGLQYYRYCPKDSPFAPLMRKYFHLPEDYYEEPVEKVPPY